MDRDWRRNPDILFPALLVLAWILFFSDPLFSSKNFYFRDILNFHYPLRKVLMDCYSRGEFPLWNPYIYFGQPMLANPNYLAFYPTNLFHLLLPFNYASKLHFIIHPLLGGLGIYFLQRRLGILPAAAFAGSLVYQFSGTVLSFLNLYSIVSAVALLPWAGWAFLRALSKPGWRSALLFGAVLSLQLLSFEPLLFQCSLVLLTGLAILFVLESKARRTSVFQALRVGCVGLVFGLGLAAVQVIPTVELIPLSARLSGYDWSVQSRWSMHPLDFLNVLIPNLFGNPYTVYRIEYWGDPFHDGREAYLVSFFLGTGFLLLASVSFLSPRRWLRRVMLCGTLVSCFLAFGKFNPLYSWIFEQVSVFRLGRYPSKYFLLATLCLAVLSSMGLETLFARVPADAQKSRRILMLGLCGGIVALVLIGAWSYCSLHPDYLAPLLRSNMTPSQASVKDFSVIVPQLSDSIRMSGFFLFLSSVLVCLFARGIRASLMGGLLVLAVGIETASANLRLVPLISEADVEFVPEVNTYLQSIQSDRPFRVVSLDSLRATSPPLRIPSANRSWAWFTFFFRMTGQPMYGIMNGVQYSFDQSVDYLNTVESDVLSKACSNLPDPAGLTLMERVNSPIVLTLSEIRDPRARLLDSFEPLTADRLKVYQLDRAMPRAYFVGGSRRALSHMDALGKFLDPDFEPQEVVILEGSQVEERAGVSEPGTVRILEYAPGRVVCEVDARTPGYLVLLDSYYPGWQTYLDGKEMEILRANYAFRAVDVPAGKHRAEFVYRPRSFYAGLWITIVALLVGLAAIFWRHRNLGNSSGLCHGKESKATTKSPRHEEPR